MLKTFLVLLLVSLGAGQTRIRPNQRPLLKSEEIVIEASGIIEKKGTSEKAEVTPGKAELTPGKAEEALEKADDDTSFMMANMSWTYDIVQSSGKFCPERDKCR